MSRTRLCWWISLGLTLAAASTSLVVYPRLPAELPIHWNIHGRADGFAGKPWAAFLSPAIMALVVGFFAAIPWLSPRGFSDAGFRTTNLQMMTLLVGLLAYIHACTLYSGLTGGADVGRPLIAGMFFFFAAIGALMPHVQRNFYVGIRTPWTLADPRVWVDTHRFGKWCFVVGGAAGFLWTALGGSIAVALTAFLTAALAPVLYSFLRYRRMEKEGLLSR